MKQRFEVKTGVEIPTLGGYLYVEKTAYNPDTAYCKEVEVDEMGDETFVGDRILTANDIQRILREAEGRIYNVVFVDDGPTEEELAADAEAEYQWLAENYPRLASPEEACVW